MRGDEIRVMLRCALNERPLSRQSLHLRRQSRARYRVENILGNSAAMFSTGTASVLANPR